MRRQAIRIAAIVFACSALAELLSVYIAVGSIEAWLAHPRRVLLLITMLVVNIFNAATAGYLAFRMRDATSRWQSSEHERQMTNQYLNHHVRNALAALQYAAYLTKDVEVVSICNDSVSRIVLALTNAERGIRRDEEQGKPIMSAPRQCG